MREQLEERRGVQCKLCSLSFVEGQTIQVPDNHRRDTVISNSLASAENRLDNGEKEVPIFGYQISMQMACKLVEIYRDAKFPLSLLARDILLDYSKVVDLPQDDGTRGGVVATASKSVQPGAVQETIAGAGSSHNNNIRKKRTGWMTVCYHCFTILEEHHYYQYTSAKLYKAFGIDPSVNNMGVALASGNKASTIGSSNQALPSRPSSANKARRSASTGTLPTAPSKTSGVFSTECMRYGKPEPWSRSAFERSFTFQP